MNLSSIGCIISYNELYLLVEPCFSDAQGASKGTEERKEGQEVCGRSDGTSYKSEHP